MSDQYTFERPRRPLGVHAFNAVGGVLRKAGLRLGTFREQALLKWARRLTGLSDFGDEGFREPLRVLLNAYENESNLNEFGRLFVWISTLNLLCNRLRVQKEIADHPEILDIEIRKPLFVAGLPRTGTTLLYNLLAQDPAAARPLMMWEALNPAQRRKEKDRQPDPRINRAVRAMRVMDRLAPKLAAVHRVDPTGPEECSRLQMCTFVTAYALMESYVPSYRDWLFRQPIEVWQWAYRDYRRYLQILQWQHAPANHWVLKSPAHIFGLPALMSVFPDACVIQTHRDPQRVIPSLCSLFAVYQGISSDLVRVNEVAQELVEACAEGLRRSFEAREAAEPGRIFDLRYTDLLSEPVTALRNIYEHFGYDFSTEFERRARNWHGDNPQHKHGKHRYDLDQFGLSRQTVDSVYASYCQQYGIEPERSRSTPPEIGAGSKQECCREVTSQS